MELNDTSVGGASKVKVVVAPCPLAATETVVSEATLAAVAVNVALVVPAAMVMDGGIVTLVLEELSATKRVLKAGLDNLNVQVAVPGVCTVDGVQASVGEFAFRSIVRVVVCVLAPAPAATTDVPFAAPAATVALNVADVFPAWITAEPGTVTLGLLDVKGTSRFPLSTALVSETVQVLQAPGAMVCGVQLTEDTAAGPVTFSENVVLLLLTVAVKTALRFAPTVPAVAVKAALFEPLGMKTEPGTVTEGLPLDNATVIPPLGAFAVSVTVQLLLAPDPILAGLQARLATPIPPPVG